MSRKNKRYHTLGRKKTKTFNRQTEIESLSMALVLNGHAIEEGPKRKSWHVKDVKHIQPMRPAQSVLFNAWRGGNHICAYGSAGTGKTFLSLYLALREVLNKQHSNIIIVRSAVPTRDVGFLPGTLEEKIAYYETPYHDIMCELLGKASTYQDMKDAGLITFMSTTCIRGITWDDAIIVIDEGENMTIHEIDSIMTRVGQNTRVMFNGDVKQTDLNGRQGNICGIGDAIKVFDKMAAFETVQFFKEDIVRSDFVKEWITISEEVLM